MVWSQPHDLMLCRYRCAVTAGRTRKHSPALGHQKAHPLFHHQSLLLREASNFTPTCLPKRNKNVCLHKTCTGMFMEASLIVTKNNLNGNNLNIHQLVNGKQTMS